MDYMVSFSIDRDGSEQNAVDRFVAWYDAGSDQVTKVDSTTWFIAPGQGFKREVDEEGPTLRTVGLDSTGLHAVLSAFFRFADGQKGYAAVSSLDADGPARVVLISNDPAVAHDPTGVDSGGVMQTYQAGAVLTGAAVFAGLQTQMFGHAAVPGEEEADDDDTENVVTGRGPWLFADVSGAIDDAEELTVLIGGADIVPETVLEQVLGLPDYKISAGDYFSFEDATTGAIIVAQQLPTQDGPYVELRLTLPAGLTEQEVLRRLNVAMGEKSTMTLLRVIEYDDIEGVVHANPVHRSGDEGPMRILKLAF